MYWQKSRPFGRLSVCLFSVKLFFHFEQSIAPIRIFTNPRHVMAHAKIYRMFHKLLKSFCATADADMTIFVHRFIF